MPAKRLSMRRIREVLRSAAEGLSRPAISSRLGIPRSTVRRYLDRLRLSGLFHEWEPSARRGVEIVHELKQTVRISEMLTAVTPDSEDPPGRSRFSASECEPRCGCSRKGGEQGCRKLVSRNADRSVYDPL